MKKLIGLLMILCMVLLYSCSGPMDSPKHSNNSKPVVVIYGDYKCPYCKKTEDRVMPKLKKKYIDTNKIKYQYVNLAFLGKDSIVGSRAQHAVNHYLLINKTCCNPLLMFIFLLIKH
jgi:protein-disulfide isomerase